MATGMHIDEMSVDSLVLCRHDQDRTVSARSVSMPALTLCEKINGSRELLLIDQSIVIFFHLQCSRVGFFVISAHLRLHLSFLKNR